MKRSAVGGLTRDISFDLVLSIILRIESWRVWTRAFAMDPVYSGLDRLSRLATCSRKD